MLGTVHNLDAQDRWHNEEQYWTLALALRERAFGPDHPLTLHTAFELGNLHCVQCKPEDVHPGSKDIFGSGFKTDYGWMPQSLEANCHDAVVRLWDSKSDMDNTPLVWAASNGHYAVVKLLLLAQDVIDLFRLDSPDSKIDNDYTALESAVRQGHEADVKLLLLGQDAIDQEYNINYGHTWLYCLTWTSAIDEVAHHYFARQRMSTRRISSCCWKLALIPVPGTMTGQTALSLAVQNGHKALARLLLLSRDAASIKHLSGVLRQDCTNYIEEPNISEMR